MSPENICNEWRTKKIKRKEKDISLDFQRPQSMWKELQKKKYFINGILYSGSEEHQ